MAMKKSAKKEGVSYSDEKSDDDTPSKMLDDMLCALLALSVSEPDKSNEKARNRDGFPHDYYLVK